MARFQTRAIEFHSGYVWNFDWIRQGIEFARRHEMTSLVLHRNDIVDMVVYPGALFGASNSARSIFERYRDIYPKLYKYTPTRRSGPYQRRDYLRRVIDLADRNGIEVWFQNKELSFPDILLELNPQLVKDGTLCPNDSFWWDFVDHKYSELFQDFPEIAGIITAPGTGESRLAISSNRCTCEACKGSTPQGWYRKLIMAMHKPIRSAGRELVIRDFVFDKKAQTELAETISELPEDVIVSLKNTPHDYYPTFPDNPRLGDVGKHRQWVEFDTMGQYFGWGIGPAIIIDDYRKRMTTAVRHGVEGMILRTDWESLDGHSSFHTPNRLNLHAAAALAVNADASDRAIHRSWLIETGMVRSESSETDLDAAADWSARLFARSWEIVAKSLFVNDCVFSDSSNYPVSLDHAWWLAEKKNSLKDWDPAKENALQTSESNVRKILADKDEALKLVGMQAKLVQERPAALTEAAHTDLIGRMETFKLYVAGWRAVVHACILTKFLSDHPESTNDFAQEVRSRVVAAFDLLQTLADEMRAYAAATDQHFATYNMLGWERLLTLRSDLAGRLADVPPVTTQRALAR
ncbi:MULTISPECIES: hypothetical protein [unclassified Chelatococcus]|uniref:hypothetical protein n=1 Tax=unclassified Chelatococcus TaxID=2638111 RepID=UPI001BCD3C8D|nr:MULTISPECIES: hypothetical protein [unclassified Chelatococcus]MBS7700397.1 hypothetical protein [Chelatococcus sp. YT9]MBX3556193.1 hypothetical protein [Chelatococcus sp.]